MKKDSLYGVKYGLYVYVLTRNDRPTKQALNKITLGLNKY